MALFIQIKKIGSILTFVNLDPHKNISFLTSCYYIIRFLQFCQQFFV